MSNLFVLGDVRLSSGAKSFFKIEADALTDGDIQCLARLALDRVPPFGKVIGVPRGGLRLAAALEPFCRPYCSRVLITDDVYTSGKTICRVWSEVRSKFRSDGEDVCGLVIFARERIEHHWVTPIFQLAPATNE